MRGYVIALFGGVLTVSCSVLTNFDALQCAGGACGDAGAPGEASTDAKSAPPSRDAGYTAAFFVQCLDAVGMKEPMLG